MARFVCVVGARPNFMKVAPLLRALEAKGHSEVTLVHTGQHYDPSMSASFFRDLDMREPDVNLGVGSGTHATQTAAVLTGMESVLREVHPDLVIVVGDVNSTLAAALSAVKLHIPVAHVEAGLRSGDRYMPEEINRVLTDQLSALCLTPSRDAGDNLRREGISEDRVHFVGNIMIDSLRWSMARVDTQAVLEKYGLEAGMYGLVTLHRPSNVDQPARLEGILRGLDDVARETPLVFPAHPRTLDRLRDFPYQPKRIRLLDPLPYLELLPLLTGASVVFTDSGGIQEESTALGVPCLTLRSTTERPITVAEGTNVLVPDRSPEAILKAYRRHGRDVGEPSLPEGWDGRAAERIADVFDTWLENGRWL